MNIIGMLSLGTIAPISTSIVSAPGIDLYSIYSLELLIKLLNKYKDGVSFRGGPLPPIGGIPIPSSSIEEIPSDIPSITLPMPEVPVTSIPLVVPGEEQELAKLYQLLYRDITLKHTQEEVIKRVSKLNNQIIHLQGKVIPQHERRIEQLEGEIESLDSQIKALDEQIKSLESTVKALEASPQPTSKAQAVKLRAQLERLKAQRRALKQQKRQKERQKAIEERRLDSAKRRLERLNSQHSKYRTAKTRIRQKIVEIEREIDELMEKMITDDLNPQLKQLVREVKAYGRKGYIPVFF